MLYEITKTSACYEVRSYKSEGGDCANKARHGTTFVMVFVTPYSSSKEFLVAEKELYQWKV